MKKHILLGLVTLLPMSAMAFAGPVDRQFEFQATMCGLNIPMFVLQLIAFLFLLVCRKKRTRSYETLRTWAGNLCKGRELLVSAFSLFLIGMVFGSYLWTFICSSAFFAGIVFLLVLLFHCVLFCFAKQRKKLHSPRYLICLMVLSVPTILAVILNFFISESSLYERIFTLTVSDIDMDWTYSPRPITMGDLANMYMSVLILLYIPYFIWVMLLLFKKCYRWAKKGILIGRNTKPYLFLILLLLLIPIVMVGGRYLGKYNPQGVSTEFSHHESKRSVYWWKTVYDPDSTELSFLKEHDIQRMYVRYFDVIYDPANRPEPIVPNATLQFRQSFPEGVEIVPTIFITNEAMGSWPKERTNDYYYWEPEPMKSTGYYVDQIIYRIKAMNARNQVHGIREVQVDCDWSRTTRESFFKFCRLLRERLHAEGIALSSTIRMHQLREDAPPVDRGVLMCYNTGALRNVTTKNSILSADDVYSHMKGVNMHDFGIPMDVAYPTFGWSAMYSQENRFLGLVRTTDLSDTTTFEPQGDGLYKILRDCSAGHAVMKAGNILRLEESEFSTVSQVKSQIDLKRDQKELGYSTILYHLDSTNLSKYTYEEIESLYQ